MNPMFPLALKSTLDKIIKDLADAHNYDFIDLDGAYLMADVMESQASALAWNLTQLIEYPRAPLWQVEFEAGGKTSNDPSQYVSMEIASLVQTKFFVGASFPIMDYSGSAAPTQKLGELFVTSVGVSPAQFDRVAGLRLIRILAAAMEM